MENRPRLRDGGRLRTHDLYPLNIFPDDLVKRIGGYIVYIIYIGHRDIGGNDWGDAFADSMGGTHILANGSVPLDLNERLGARFPKEFR